MRQVESEFIERQKIICQKYSANYLAYPFENMAGVALESFKTVQMPINGLRHPVVNNQTVTWYIWSGEYSEAHDFFKPVPMSHLLDICPKALNYLGLAPGWRFLFDNVYEDVWYDATLLHI